MIILLVFYITVITTLAIGSVGDIPVCDGEPYTMGLPFLVFLLISVPAGMGFMIGYDKIER